MAPPSTRPGPSPRRGRPPSAERAVRRQAALDTAAAEITEHGYESLTMLAVAQRAGSSKESLYAWFGNKEQMVAELIRQQAARTNSAVEAALRLDHEPYEILVAIATNLLELLVGQTSLALNRAAMTSPELATVLLRHGRHTTGPLIERYLTDLAQAGVIHTDDVDEAFRLFYGLVVQDAQIRALLGEDPPSQEERARRATLAVIRFLAFSAPDRSGTGGAT